MSKFHFAITFLAFTLILAAGTVLSADDVTIRGKIVNPRQKDLPIGLNDLKIKLEEQIQFDPLPTPANWSTMEVADRQKWFNEFRDSEKGKAFFEQRQKKFDNRKQFDVKVEDDGSFVLFDVPPGSYGISGRANKSFKSRQFAFEVFGQVDVGKVDEIQLGEMQVLATRLLSIGENAPSFELKTVDGKGSVSKQNFDKQFVLVYFWSASSPPCVNDLKTLAAMRKGLKAVSANIEFLGICLDKENTQAKKLIAENKISWPQGSAEGWQSETVEDFGVRSIPFYCLIDGKGKIAINNALFYQLFQTGQVNFEKILNLALAGKDMQKQLEALQKQNDQK